MKILVIGAGALGSLVGGILSTEHDVTIIGRSEQVWVLKKKGLRIEGLTVGEYKIKAFTYVPTDEIYDLIIICVKAYNTEMTLTPLTPLLEKGTRILSLQNGLDNEERILKYIKERNIPSEVIGGITCHGVTYKGPGLVKHAGTGDSMIGHFGWGSRESHIEDIVPEIADAFKRAGMDMDITTRIDREIWAKAIINSAINPLTAIVGALNGILIDNDDMNKMTRELVIEGVQVANAMGVDLTEEEMFRRTFDVARRTRTNISSMYQDIKLKRRTEVDSINGAITRKGELSGVPTPLNNAMVRLVKGLEERNLQDPKE
ncbi:MAG: 2-dehydropantoate 2-reductase [Candidatus Thermoplasmatota archaeon]|nr:2-dehydropantoate 2-reductase [Candidatus Thermoplasmatota archaeon]